MGKLRNFMCVCSPCRARLVCAFLCITGDLRLLFVDFWGSEMFWFALLCYPVSVLFCTLPFSRNEYLDFDIRGGFSKLWFGYLSIRYCIQIDHPDVSRIMCSVCGMKRLENSKQLTNYTDIKY